MTNAPDYPRLQLRLHLADGAMIGPGKAELLERIMDTGSIAAAGRAMGMSYKRAWQLVETMNEMFHEPVVHSTRGGARGGGAEVTETGRQVLAAYRAMEAEARAAAAPQVATLERLRSDMSGRK